MAENKWKKWQCIIALKNKTVALRKIVEIQKFWNHGSLRSHFLLLYNTTQYNTIQYFIQEIKKKKIKVLKYLSKRDI